MPEGFTQPSAMVCGDNSGIERAGLIAAVEQAADAIVITGVDGTIQYANPAFTTLSGYTKASTPCERSLTVLNLVSKAPKRPGNRRRTRGAACPRP